VERFARSKNIPSGAAGDPASLDEPPASLSPRRAARMAFVSSFSFWREERQGSGERRRWTRREFTKLRQRNEWKRRELREKRMDAKAAYVQI